jgi:hypothetical protein
MCPQLDPARVEDFGRRLTALPRLRVDQQSLWKAFAEAFPARPQGAEERIWLLAALDSLAREGLIALPSTRGNRWDKNLGVAVPSSVNVVAAQAPGAGREWRSFPWHPKLQWVADLKTVPSEHLAFLHSVHAALITGGLRGQAPSKYRSIQLTGDEKALVRLCRTKLFGPGRLSLDLLGCILEVTPLAWDDLGSQPVLLVFENVGPFSTARQVLAELPEQPYGAVACGEGTRFVSSVQYVATLPRRFERIEYVGDLDHEGLRIAAAVTGRAARLGLPALHPAAGVHEAMLKSAAAFGHPLGWPDPNSTIRKSVADFLAGSLAEKVREIIRAKRRVPEEVLGPEEFMALWAPSRPV